MNTDQGRVEINVFYSSDSTKLNVISLSLFFCLLSIIKDISFSFSSLQTHWSMSYTVFSPRMQEMQKKKLVNWWTDSSPSLVGRNRWKHLVSPLCCRHKSERTTVDGRHAGNCIVIKTLILYSTAIRTHTSTHLCTHTQLVLTPIPTHS